MTIRPTLNVSSSYPKFVTKHVSLCNFFVMYFRLKLEQNTGKSIQKVSTGPMLLKVTNKHKKYEIVQLCNLFLSYDWRRVSRMCRMGTNKNMNENIRVEWTTNNDGLVSRMIWYLSTKVYFFFCKTTESVVVAKWNFEAIQKLKTGTRVKTC